MSDLSTHSNTQPKRSKPTHDDRLSELPDLALVHILSHLFIEEAARTSVLSKRFNSLWTAVGSLNFSDERFGENTAGFVGLVDAAVRCHRRKEIDKFSVVFNHYAQDYKNSVDRWMYFTAEKKAKSLHLNLLHSNSRKLPGQTREGYKLPSFVYKNGNLVELVTSCCTFSLKKEINWGALKFLSITRTKVLEELISKILSGCKALETLELKHWSGFDKLKINSSSLKVLRIVGEKPPKYVVQPGNDCLLEISGPNLVSLELSGPLYRTRIRVSDVGSLMNAVMNFEIPSLETPSPAIPFLQKGPKLLHIAVDIVREVLESLCLVKGLTVGGLCLRALTACEASNLSSPWSERKSLTLYMPVLSWDHRGIASLLQSSPYLETLVINLSYCSKSCVLLHSHYDDKYMDCYWKSWKTISKCPLLYLKTVKVVGFQVSCRSLKPLFQFLEFLLTNSRVLEEIVIQASRYVMREALDEAEKLLSVTTASPDAVVLFEPPHLWVDPLCIYHERNPTSLTSETLCTWTSMMFST